MQAVGMPSFCGSGILGSKDPVISESKILALHNLWIAPTRMDGSSVEKKQNAAISFWPDISDVSGFPLSYCVPLELGISG